MRCTNARTWLVFAVNTRRSNQFAYRALDLAPSQRQKDRILGDIAASFMYLGLDDVARDAYLCSRQRRRSSTCAGCRSSTCWRSRRSKDRSYNSIVIVVTLSITNFTPQLRVVYLIHVGRGYHTLGDSTTGIAYLERAVEIAEQFRLNQLLFEAEQALGEARRRAAITRRTSTLDTKPVQEVIGVIRELKEMAGVG